MRYVRQLLVRFRLSEYGLLRMRKCCSRAISYRSKSQCVCAGVRSQVIRAYESVISGVSEIGFTVDFHVFSGELLKTVRNSAGRDDEVDNVACPGQ